MQLLSSFKHISTLSVDEIGLERLTQRKRQTKHKRSDLLNCENKELLLDLPSTLKVFVLDPLACFSSAAKA